jgi:hypothetical protein
MVRAGAARAGARPRHPDDARRACAPRSQPTYRVAAHALAGADLFLDGTVDLEDLDLVVALVGLGEVAPGGRQALTVTAPWREVLDEQNAVVARHHLGELRRALDVLLRVRAAEQRRRRAQRERHAHPALCSCSARRRALSCSPLAGLQAVPARRRAGFFFLILSLLPCARPRKRRGLPARDEGGSSGADGPLARARARATAGARPRAPGRRECAAQRCARCGSRECAAQHCAALRSTAQHGAALRSTALHCAAQRCSASSLACRPTSRRAVTSRACRRC